MVPPYAANPVNVAVDGREWMCSFEWSTEHVIRRRVSHHADNLHWTDSLGGSVIVDKQNCGNELCGTVHLRPCCISNGFF